MARNRFRRWTRRILGIMVGLMLGWMAASHMPGLPFVHADNTPAPPASTTAAHDHATAAHDHAHDHADATQSDSHGDEHRVTLALVPTDDAGHPIIASWYSSIVIGIAGLFAAALIVGLIARSQGLEDPGPAATAHDQAHDDHHHADASHHGDHPHGHDAHDSHPPAARH